MKYLRNNLKVIIGFLIGVILASCMTVYATSYFAKDISYTNGEVEMSVEDALNDLYLRNKTLNSCKYLEFNHISNTQFNYDFGFAPSSFLAFFAVGNGSHIFLTYTPETNSLFVFDDQENERSSLFSINETKLISNIPTNWDTYRNQYKIYVFAK